MEAGVRGMTVCGLGLILLGMWACGESSLFGNAGATGSAQGGGGASSDGGAGGAMTSSAGGSAAGPSTGGNGGTAGSGGAAAGGAGGEEPWVQPPCNPPCDLFSVCCDKGDGSPPSCVNNATGCKCDVTEPGASCGGFAGDCCAKPGATIGTCKSGRGGCACNPDQGCGITNTCCDKGNGGFECSNSASECLCGSDPEICDFIFDTCCDKGNDDRCYTSEDGCL